MYNQLTKDIIAQIKAVSDHVTTGADINEDYAKDEMPIYGTRMPDLAVQPRSTKEVADVVKICYDNNIPMTPAAQEQGRSAERFPSAEACLSISPGRTGSFPMTWRTLWWKWKPAFCSMTWQKTAVQKACSIRRIREKNLPVSAGTYPPMPEACAQ